MPLGFHRKPTGKPGEWFYCIKHGKVEEGPECPAKDRLGPYDSPEEAAHALQLADERNREWRQGDERWNDGPKGGDGE
ncbi:hypothetical protein ACIPLC_03655 [Kitasatospora sp. NPDC086801]|uniref:hypothetical protein n=1 Tax=Kitasatospora sp. NPDC086801 TaxID=3364066 RepID=UPI0038178E56